MIDKLAMQIKPKLESPQMQRSMEPLFDLWRATSLNKIKIRTKGLNIPLADDNKDVYKRLMHLCIGVCVERKLVPLIFSKLSCSTDHKNVEQRHTHIFVTHSLI